jgi:hypothetical protein
MLTAFLMRPTIAEHNKNKTCEPSRKTRHRKHMKTETKADYEIAREELNELFASLKLPVVISDPVGVVGEGDWPCIRYSVAIGGEFFEYSLGIGHVDWKKPYALLSAGSYDRMTRLHHYSRLLNEADADTIRVYSAGKKFVTNHNKRVADCAEKLALIQKKQPNPAEVLASVCREGQDADQSFMNWCMELGYDEDSRKAESIYSACTDNGKKARRILSPANFAKFAELSARL